MKIQTTAKLATIAKMLAKKNPSEFRACCIESEPMLRNISLVPEIAFKIDEEFPELDKTDKSILYAASVYFAYSPATMIDTSLERLPNGIRQQMCDVMQWKDAPICNYYSNIAVAYFKGKSFREKVERVLAHFQGWSVKRNQIELF